MARLRAVQPWALAELATGLALLAIPATVIEALVGPSDATSSLVGRVLGATLVSLGLAALSDREAPGRGIVLGFVVYYALTTVILAAAGIAGTADGFLLWPVVALHALGGAVLALGSRSTS